MASFDIMNLIRVSGGQNWQRFIDMNNILKGQQGRPKYEEPPKDSDTGKTPKETEKPPKANQGGLQDIGVARENTQSYTGDAKVDRKTIVKKEPASQETMKLTTGTKQGPNTTTSISAGNQISKKENIDTSSKPQMRIIRTPVVATTNYPIPPVTQSSQVTEETQETDNFIDDITTEMDEVVKDEKSFDALFNLITDKEKDEKRKKDLVDLLIRRFPSFFNKLKLSSGKLRAYIKKFLANPDSDDFLIRPDAGGLSLRNKVILYALAGILDNYDYEDLIDEEVNKAYQKLGVGLDKSYQFFITKSLYSEIKDMNSVLADALVKYGLDYESIKMLNIFTSEALKTAFFRDYSWVMNRIFPNGISADYIDSIKKLYNRTYFKVIAGLIDYMSNKGEPGLIAGIFSPEAKQSLDNLQKIILDFNALYKGQKAPLPAPTTAYNYNSLANRIAAVLVRNNTNEIYNMETQLGITHGTLRDYYLSLPATGTSFIHQWAIAHNYTGKSEAELWELFGDELGLSPEQLQSFMVSANSNPQQAIHDMLAAGAGTQTVTQVLQIAGVGAQFNSMVLSEARRMGIVTNVPVNFEALLNQFAQEHNLTPLQTMQLAQALNKLPESVMKEIERLSKYQLNAVDLELAYNAIAQLIKVKLPGFENMKVEDIKELLTISGYASLTEVPIDADMLQKLKKDNPYLADILQNQGPQAYKRAAEKQFKDSDPEGYKIWKEKGPGAYEAYINEKKRIFIADLKSNDPEGYKIFTQKGYDAYTKYINDRIKQFEERLALNDPEGFKIYKKSGYGSYEKYAEAKLTRDAIALEIILKTNDPEGLKVFLEAGGGPKGYNAFIVFDEKRYNEQLAKLKEYELPLLQQRKMMGGLKEEEEPAVTYDIDRFIKEHPTLESIKTLKILGFDDETIKTASAYVAGVNNSISDINDFLKNKPIRLIKGQAVPLDPDSALEAAIRDVKGDIVVPFKKDLGKSLTSNSDIYVDKNGNVVTSREVLEYKWNQLTEEEKQKVAAVWGNNYYQGDYFAEYKKRTEQRLSGTDALLFAAEIFVPGLYVARHWNELSNWEKVLYIGLDALSVGVVGASSIKVIGAAARGVGYSSRLARLGAAARALGELAIAQVKAPVDLILHPIKTGKSMINLWKDARDLFELLSHPNRIREAAITTASGQVMIRASDMAKMSIKDAQLASDRLMEKLARGEKLLFKVNGKVVELAQSPLMKKVAGAAHSTTDLTEFEKGLVVKYESGLPISEQGLFLSNEPVTNYTYMSATGKGAIPIATEASGKAERVFMYKPLDIARMDSVPVRELTFAHCKNIGEDAAPIIEKIVRKYGGKLGGSWTFYIKVPKAPKPNDLDWILDKLNDARAARKEIVDALNKAGIKARYGKSERSVEIYRNGEWKEAVDIWLTAGHDSQIPKEYIQATKNFKGFNIESLGEQYIRQSYGSTTAEAKVEKRIKSVNKVAPELEKLLKNDGAKVRKPGVIIYDPKTAQEAISTKKIFNPSELDFEPVKEVESKLKVGYKTPPANQKLWFRCGPRGIRTELWLVKPLDRLTILKLKDLGLLEDIKAPFNPAVKISDFSDESKLRQLTNLLTKQRNITRAQASNTLRAYRVITSSVVRRPAPSLENLGIRRSVVSNRTIKTERIPRTTRIERIPRTTRSERAPRATRIERMPRATRAERVPRTTADERVPLRKTPARTASNVNRRVIPREERPNRITPRETPRRISPAGRTSRGVGREPRRPPPYKPPHRGYKNYPYGKKQQYGRIIPPRIPRVPRVTPGKNRLKKGSPKIEDRKWTPEEIRSAVAFRMGALAHTSKALIHDDSSIYLVTNKRLELPYPPNNVTREVPSGFADSGWRSTLPENERRSNLERAFVNDDDDIIEGLMALTRVSKQPGVIQAAKKDLEYFRRKANPEDIPPQNLKISLKKVSKEFPDIQRIYPLEPVTIARKAPYTHEDEMVIVGDTPPGMEVKPNMFSAKKSIQLLTNQKAPSVITGKVGFQNYKIMKPNRTPGGGHISFHPNQGVHSEKQGQIYHTNLGGKVVLSRKPLRQGGKKRR